MTDNIYEKLTHVRKPRVHIRYDVETENGVEQHELPFVIGVMGDFSGHPTKPLPPLKNRKFISIDQDNFDQVMENMNIGLNLNIDNVLNQKKEKLSVRLAFKSMKDFEPDRLVEQVEPLRQLKQARDRLMMLLNKADQSEILGDALEKVLKDNQQLQSLLTELNSQKSLPENLSNKKK